MFKRGLVSVVTLALALVACGEEDPGHEPGEGVEQTPLVDGSTPLPVPATSTGDAGAPARDASVMSGQDASSVLSPDASTPIVDAGDAPSSLATKFFLPTGEPTNTAAPSLELDAQGNTHMVYPKYVRGNAFYAFCPAGACTGAADVQLVELETDGTVSNAMLALTADGKPRILLNSFAYLYYGECDGNCGVRESWRYEMILKHDNDKEVTGEAFTLDPEGHPRFLIATYRALFGIGQKPAKTELAQCDADCSDPSSWRYDTIADPEIWYGSTLRYDRSGRIHVATNLYDYSPENPSPAVAAYLSCSENCTSKDGWANSGVGFFAPYESTTEAVSMKPEVSLALTGEGHPRVAQIHQNQDGVKTVAYFSCEQDCSHGQSWVYAFSVSGADVHSGLDLALDAQDHPRLVHTVNYDIAVSYCDESDCSHEGAKWTSGFVEQGGAIPADQIFLEWNCNVGAWFLHDPSIAIGSDGKPMIGYQARDISGGVSNPDPTKPRCVAGTDMTWSRLAVGAGPY